MENILLALLYIIAPIAFFGTLIGNDLAHQREIKREEDKRERLNRVFREAGYEGQVSAMTYVLIAKKARYKSLMIYGVLTSFSLGMTVSFIYRAFIQ